MYTQNSQSIRISDTTITGHR